MARPRFCRTHVLLRVGSASGEAQRDRDGSSPVSCLIADLLLFRAARGCLRFMAGPADPQPLERNLMMALSDAAAREMANVLQKHVNQKALVLIIDELLEIRGDKDFR